VTQLRLAEAELTERVGRGVYRVAGAQPSEHMAVRVAWLRLDPARPCWERDGLGDNDGVVSHRSACVLHGLGDIPAPQVELTVKRRRTTREPAVRLLTRSDLAAVDVTTVDGLPVTTVERTIIDLIHDHADGGHIGGVLLDAERRGMVDLDALAARLDRQNPHTRPVTARTRLSRLASLAGGRLRGDQLMPERVRAALADVVLPMRNAEAAARETQPTQVNAREEQDSALQLVRDWLHDDMLA
jgi:hypothetical protein